VKLSALELDRRILVMGSGGTGKTTLVGTLCQLIPTLVVTGDVNGLETLKAMGVDPEVILVKDWRRIWDYYKEIVEGATQFKAIAIDDMGAVQETARHKIERMPRGWQEEKLTPREFIPQVQRELLLGERRLQLQQWGEMWIAIETFIYELLNLPYQVKLVTTLEGVHEHPRDSKDHVYPALTGQVRETLSARFSLVAETFIYEAGNKLHYCLTSRSHPRMETKDRYVTGGRTWVDPSMAKVLAHIAGKGEEENEVEKRIGLGLR